MEQVVEELSKLPLEGKIAYGIIGVIMLAAIIFLPVVIYWSIRLVVTAPAWIIRKFGVQKREKPKDDNTPAAV